MLGSRHSTSQPREKTSSNAGNTGFATDGRIAREQWVILRFRTSPPSISPEMNSSNSATYSSRDRNTRGRSLDMPTLLATDAWLTKSFYRCHCTESSPRQSSRDGERCPTAPAKARTRHEPPIHRRHHRQRCPFHKVANRLEPTTACAAPYRMTTERDSGSATCGGKRGCKQGAVRPVTRARRRRRQRPCLNFRLDLEIGRAESTRPGSTFAHTAPPRWSRNQLVTRVK